MATISHGRTTLVDILTMTTTTAAAAAAAAATTTTTKMMIMMIITTTTTTMREMISLRFLFCLKVFKMESNK